MIFINATPVFGRCGIKILKDERKYNITVFFINCYKLKVSVVKSAYFGTI